MNGSPFPYVNSPVSTNVSTYELKRNWVITVLFGIHSIGQMLLGFKFLSEDISYITIIIEGILFAVCITPYTNTTLNRINATYSIGLVVISNLTFYLENSYFDMPRLISTSISTLFMFPLYIDMSSETLWWLRPLRKAQVQGMPPPVQQIYQPQISPFVYAPAISPAYPPTVPQYSHPASPVKSYH